MNIYWKKYKILKNMAQILKSIYTSDGEIVFLKLCLKTLGVALVTPLHAYNNSYHTHTNSYSTMAMGFGIVCTSSIVSGTGNKQMILLTIK
jgi:hypothetical protein